ncbi:DNA helicase [Phaffia rhodozyma]|uniref:DNA helicase n=1 Tax=Phaffia rhodozyma TaxID=264483 RepID=A0A0F7SLT8_PHARH|nr:DNA helicase [Phaffia rhodozyma]
MSSSSPAFVPSLYKVRPPSSATLGQYLDRLSHLLDKELETDQARTALLSTSCSWEVLAQKGLAINGLGVSGVNIGLGGKSLVSLHRPSAFHTDPKLPSHGFRNGDPAKIVPQETVRKGKTSKKPAEEEGKEVEGIIYKVTETIVILAVSVRDGDDLEIPERCRLIKTAATGTFDRMGKALDKVRRLIQADGPASTSDTTIKPTPSETTTSTNIIDVSSSNSVSEETLENAPTTTQTIGENLIEQPINAPEGAEDELDERMSEKVQEFRTSPFSNYVRGPRPEYNSVPLLKTLFGLSPPTSTPIGEINLFDESLNQSQKEAVRFALESNEVACIHGPPGTGKTFTLVEIIRQLIRVEKKRVLVCGASNLSVDNLLLRLSPLFPPQSITRIGHPARILPILLPTTLDYQTAHSSSGEVVKDVKKELDGHLDRLSKGRKEKGSVKGKERFAMYSDVRELRKEFRKREAGVVRNVLSTTEIVLATCHTAGSRQLFGQDFDVVIIDEATQALEAVCLIPILKAKKLILAGDPCQLGPTVLSETTHRKIVKQTDQAPKKKTRTDLSKEGNQITLEGKAAKLDLHGTSLNDDKEEEIDELEIHPDQELVKNLTESTATEIQETELKPLRSLATTLFMRLENLYGPGIKKILTVQYRMNHRIAEYASKALYSSLLVSHQSVSNRTLSSLPNLPDLSEDDVEFLDHPVVFFDSNGCEFYERDDGSGNGKSSDGEGSKLNENEADLVQRYVRRLITLGVGPEDIGILAAYQAQVSLLSSLLKTEYPNLLIGTVDSLQGQEREVVILSLVRSNEKREVGFLSDERRINVSMTRAKRQFVVIGDSGTVSNGSSYLKDWMIWLEENADVRFAGDEGAI